MSQLEHGGRLQAAAAQYGIPPAEWLDLSTGIAPQAWPLPPLPPEVWARLPQVEDGLAAVAAACYGAPRALPVAGSQAAIQLLPQLLLPGRVGVLEPCFSEHAQAWHKAGHEVLRLSAAAIEAQVDALDALVLANPNNPTGRHFAPAQLLDWHARLARHGGTLLVDEAFIDCTPHLSLAAHSDRQGLVVLRSFGKFYGLAGIRLGFVLAESELLARLEAMLGPWAVSGPARAIGLHALAAAQAAARQQRAEQLKHSGLRLAGLLREHGLVPTGGTALFQWLPTPQAARLQDFLARRGILVRRFHTPAALRFGLPGIESQWQRLDRALAEYRRLHP